MTDQVRAESVPLSEREQTAVQGLLAGTESAQQVTNRRSSAAADTVETIVRESFGSGMQWPFGLVALLALVGMLVTVTSIGGAAAKLYRR
ncbi:MAG: hypothetical protein ACR2JT_03930 [Nocardioidaceae bacterium]